MRNDVVPKVTGNQLLAIQFDSLGDEIANTIVAQTGQTLETPGGAVNDQIGIAIAQYTSANTAYNASLVGSDYQLVGVSGTRKQPLAYIEGLLVRFIAPTNSVASQTISIPGVGGAEPFFNRNGVQVGLNEIGAGQIILARYTTSPGTRFVIDFGTGALRDVGLTSGDVMEVGAFGLGATAPALFTGDLNTLVQTAFINVNFTATNAPTVNSGTLLVQAVGPSDTTQVYVTRAIDSVHYRRQTGGVWASWRKILDDGDIGTSSGDLVTVGNFAAVADFGTAAFLGADTAATNNTVAQRNASGQLFATFLNSASSFTTSTALTAVYVETGSDGFLRKQTKANFKTSLDLQLLTDNIFGGDLTVQGTLTASTDVVSVGSDERLKDIGEVVDPETALSIVVSARKISYTFNDLARSLIDHAPKGEQLGFMAQDFKYYPQLLAPAQFDLDEEGDSISGENYLTMKYDKMTVLLGSAIEALNNKYSALEEKFSRLENEIRTLRSENLI